MFAVSVGDTIYGAWTNAHHGAITANVTALEVKAVVDGEVFLRSQSGYLRQPLYGETLCATESEGWEVCARELSAIADLVAERLLEAQQRAARARVVIA